MNPVGQLRPSQLLFTFGVGSLVDLPRMSALVMGLDEWDTRYCTEITEERLLIEVQQRLGTQVKALRLPPAMDEDDSQSSGPSPIGVPVSAYPRWLRCRVCDTLATIDSGVFALRQDQYRADRTRYVHASCVKAKEPDAVAVRFMLACRNGHLSDFPWIDYLYDGSPPSRPKRLTLREFGVAGDASDIEIRDLEDTGRSKRLGEAFGRDFVCQSFHPHLRTKDSCNCTEPARTILLGASNAWFPIVLSAISIPAAVDKLAQLVDEHWADMQDIDTIDAAKYACHPKRMPEFAEFQVEAIWAAIEKKRAVLEKKEQPAPADLKILEWRVFSNPTTAPQSRDFKLTAVAAPKNYEAYFDQTVLVQRLREVRALVGFTRIESKGDFVEAATSDDSRSAPLSRNPPTWVPAGEVRGEGLFLQFNESRLDAWCQKPEVKDLEQKFLRGHIKWRKLRKQEPAAAHFPGIRYVLLHSFSHALMRQLAMECGYTAASLRERLYCLPTGVENGPMAGVLIYTSASDSEGTLGGLVQLGDPVKLGYHLSQALESMKLCASDPLCSEHEPGVDGMTVHGACCHACQFSSETSCERGNKYLDRTVLVPTYSNSTLAYFT
jgi:hypothetical protein